MIENKKGIFISTVSQIIGRVATLAFALISIKLITNYLGTTGTGEFNTITTYINFFIVIADLGLFSVTVREIAKNPEKEKKIISNVLFLRIITALIACVLAGAIVFSTNYGNNIKVGVLFALGFLFFNLLSSVYDIVLQYRLHMQYSALAEFLSKIVSLIALFIIIRLHGDFLWIVSTTSISGLVIYIFKWYFAKQFISFSPKYNKEISNWIMRAAIPLGAVFIVNNLFFKVDTLVLFAIKGASAVGIYSVSYKVLEVTIFVGSYFASSLKPMFSKHIDGDQQALRSVLSKAIVIMIAISMPIAIVSIVFAKEIIVFLSNNDFVSGSNALILLALTLPIIYLDALLGEVLVAKDARKLLINIAIIVLLFNLGLNILLIPIFSFMGAAFVTLISEILLLGINIHYTRKIVGYNFNLPLIFKILLVSITTLLITMFAKSLPINFLILIVFSFTLYAALIYFFKITTLDRIKGLISKGES
ncbi:MAG: flippase [bacterium]